MSGPDVTMDCLGNGLPANKLPVKCSHCTFPDIDYVPKPYLLTKGLSSPAETSPAELGNFLVRERVRRMLETVLPGACTFYPSADQKTKKPLAWWLAVPNYMLKTPIPKPHPPFCPRCHEPKVWSTAMGDVWAKMNHYNTDGVDIFKDLVWKSCGGTAEDDFEDTNRCRKESGLPPLRWSFPGLEPPSHSERWTRTMLSRDLYFTVRLEQLLKRAKVKGQLVRSGFFKNVKPTPEDEAWIEEKLKLLAEHGLVDEPKPAGKSSPAQKWFKQFLKKNAAKKPKAVDCAAVEKKHKLTLPPDYRDFIATVGPKSFADVNDMEVSTTTILLPEQLDFKNYRRGKVPYLEGDDAEVDGVMFAANDGGDSFVFDVSAKGNDYPVYWYRHEENTMEPYAPNFAECIKRFVQKN